MIENSSCGITVPQEAFCLGDDFSTVDKSPKPWYNLVVVKHLSSEDSVSAIIWAPTSSETSAFVYLWLLSGVI